MPFDPILALLPESKYTYTLDKNLTPVIAILPSEGSPPEPVTIPSNELAITTCAGRDGTVWVLYDDTDFPTKSILRNFDPATGLQIGSDIIPHTPAVVIASPLEAGESVRCGELGAYKSLMDIGCGQLLTVDRNSHQVIAIKVADIVDELTPTDPDEMPDPDADIGEVVKRYNLYVTPLDAAVNGAADKLLYLEGGSAKLWDLLEDEFIRTIVAYIPYFGVGGGAGTPGGGLGRCLDDSICSGPLDPGGLPTWFYDVLVSLGATGCVDEALMGTQAMKDACWANGYAIQVNGGCGHRARLYQQGVTAATNFCGDRDNGNYSVIVNLTASDGCSWAFL